MNARLITDLAIQGTNLVNIFNEIMLGVTEVAPYSPSKTYTIGNLALHFNTTTNKYDLLQCNDNLITGVFDPLKWDLFENLLAPDGAIDGGEF